MGFISQQQADFGEVPSGSHFSLLSLHKGGFPPSFRPIVAGIISVHGSMAIYNHIGPIYQGY